MARYRAFIRKHKLLLGFLSFVFIGIPEYIDALWSLSQKIGNMESVGLNITWLYAVTAPIGLGMLAIILWQYRKPSEKNTVAWQVYDSLGKAFRDLMHTEDKKKRPDIYAQIEIERGKLPDKGLDLIIDEGILDVERERAELNMTSYSDDAEAYLTEGLKRMRSYITKKYGERNYRKRNKV